MIDQVLARTASEDRHIVGTIPADLKPVQPIIGRVGTEDHGSTISAHNLHVCLKGEVTKVRGLPNTEVKLVGFTFSDMIRSPTELAACDTTGTLIPQVSFAVICHWIEEGERAMPIGVGHEGRCCSGCY